MLRTAAIGAVVALFASSLSAQTLLAEYELLSDLKDKTAKNGPVQLTGNPTPPSAPSNGVCHNGIYRYAANGQDIRTPIISGFDATDFMVEVEFRLAALPTGSPGAPVLMGGNSYRWIGIYVSPTGVIGMKYNNSILTWSTTTLKLKTWYSAVLMYDKGSCKLMLDGVVVHAPKLPALNTGNNENFTTNDFSNGRPHNGCIRRLRIWKDANLSGGLFTLAGHPCGTLRIAGASPWPTINKPYQISVSGGNPGALAAMFFGVRFPNFLDLSKAGAPGCTWFVSPIVVVPQTLSKSGTGSTFVPIPPFLGASAWLQWVNFDPKANALRWTFSDYAILTIGK